MTLLLFLLILSVLVFVHELGHFVTAKKNGILVEEFGWGLPPRIWGKKIGETIYSINALPIGGFVKLFGEEGAEQLANGKWQMANGSGKSDVDHKPYAISHMLNRAFFAQKKRVRAVVLTAGVIMNFLLGVVLFSVIYTILGVPAKVDRVTVEAVLPGSPAEAVGLKSGEVVAAVGEERVESSNEFVDLINANQGKEIELLLGEIEGNKYGRMIRVVPRENQPEGEGALGVVVTDVEMRHFPIWQMPFRGAWFGIREAVAWGATIVGGLYMMIRDLVLFGVVPKDVAGPVGIYQLTGSAAQAGILSLLQFVGILSVNLAILNIMPFPALDGGRLLFLGVEAVTRRRVNGRIEKWAHGLGMAILLTLMLLVTLNDVVRLTGSGTIVGLIEKVLPF